MSAFSSEIAMGGGGIYKVVNNGNIPSYLHAECVKPPQKRPFLVRTRHGHGRLSLLVAPCYDQQSRRLLDRARGCALPAVGVPFHP
eukprot:scaffold122676_cov18-Phaeocystis_antarctica.AAC.1